MLDAIKVTGKGVMKKTGPSGKVTEMTDNHILNSFFAWVRGHDIFYEGISAVCKIGSGASPTDVAISSLAAPLGLEAGYTTPRLNSLSGEIAKVVNEGKDIQVSCVFKTVWPKGAVIGTVREYGLDFTDSSNASYVNTRVVLDGNNKIKGMECTTEDTLEISYILTLTIPINITNTFTLDVLGNPVEYTASIVWGQLVEFKHYMYLLGGVGLPRIGVVPSRPSNFTDIEATRTNTALLSSSYKKLMQGALVCGVKAGPLDGNWAGGFNLLHMDKFSTYARVTHGWFFSPSIEKQEGQIMLFDIRV